MADYQEYRRRVLHRRWRRRFMAAGLLFLLVLLGGGFALYWFKLRKPKPDTKGSADLDDYDFGENEDDTDEEMDIIYDVCKKAGVPVQFASNRADVPGGSTLGNLLGHQILIPMVDIGLAQLAMHSSMETASCIDAEYMAKAVAEFYNTPISQPKDGEWKLGL